jgi:hypothetical protein
MVALGVASRPAAQEHRRPRRIALAQWPGRSRPSPRRKVFQPGRPFRGASPTGLRGGQEPRRRAASRPRASPSGGPTWCRKSSRSSRTWSSPTPSPSRTSSSTRRLRSRSSRTFSIPLSMGS